MKITDTTLAAPSDIYTEDHLWDAFGHNETEASARWIVRFCKDRGLGWEPFTAGDIEAYYRANSRYRDFSFNRLIDPGAAYGSRGRTMEGGGWIVRLPDGKLRVTAEFISRCHASGKRREKSAKCEVAE